VLSKFFERRQLVPALEFRNLHRQRIIALAFDVPLGFEAGYHLAGCFADLVGGLESGLIASEVEQTFGVLECQQAQFP
jgi:hypothetical protein